MNLCQLWVLTFLNPELETTNVFINCTGCFNCFFFTPWTIKMLIEMTNVFLLFFTESENSRSFTSNNSV